MKSKRKKAKAKAKPRRAARPKKKSPSKASRKAALKARVKARAKAKAKAKPKAKAPVPAPAVVVTVPKVKPVYTKREMKDFRVLLLRRKAILAGDVKGLEGEAMKKGADAAGDLSTLPMHLADLGTDSFEQDISLGRMESESDEIKEIEEAIDRMEDGTFGMCENCEKRIPKERLKAIPYTRMCVSCKIKEENV